jgi:hypothetical protein
VEACALRQVMMIARTMLGLFRRTEYAKREISSLTRWKMAKLLLPACQGAADEL